MSVRRWKDSVSKVKTFVGTCAEATRTAAPELIDSLRDWRDNRRWRRGKVSPQDLEGSVELRTWSQPGGGGGGYTLWDTGANLPIGWLEWRDITQGNLQAIPVVGAAKHHRFALQLEAFKPGARLSLVREANGPQGEARVAVFDAGGKHRIGYILPAFTAAAGRTMVQGSEAFVIWEITDGRERIGLRACLVAPGYLGRFQSTLADLDSYESGESDDLA